MRDFKRLKKRFFHERLKSVCGSEQRGSPTHRLVRERVAYNRSDLFWRRGTRCASRRGVAGCFEAAFAHAPAFESRRYWQSLFAFVLLPLRGMPKARLFTER